MPYYQLLHRSLRWRARFVSAYDPLPLELTVDHPLLEFGGNAENLFARVPYICETITLMKKGGVLKIPSSDKPKSTPSRPNSSVTSTTTDANGSHSEHNLYWVEVLRSSRENGKKDQNPRSKKEPPSKTASWVAILPDQQSYDAPLDIEAFLTQLKNDTDVSNTSSYKAKHPLKRRVAKTQSLKCSKRKAVSYVLAIEHFQQSTVRLTDVTPRYSSTWSKTLRLRGVTGRKLAQTGGKSIDEWWTESLSAINDFYQKKSSRGTISNSRSICSSSKPSPMTKPTLFKTKITAIDGKEVELFEIASSSEDEKPDGSACLDELDQDGINHGEVEELSAAITKEPIPTSKAAFKHHPQYVIPSSLNSTEVLHPDARQRICGVFKGEMGKSIFGIAISLSLCF